MSVRNPTRMWLPNETYLLGRNSENTADISMWKLTAAEEIQAGVKVNITTSAIDTLTTISSQTASGGISAGAATFYSFAGRGYFNASSDANWALNNAAGTAHALLKLKVVSQPSTGAASTCGNVTLVAGTLTVNTTAATATCLVFFQRKTAGGTIGFATTYTINAGVSFTVTSDSALDTSVYSWRIVEAH